MLKKSEIQAISVKRNTRASGRAYAIGDVAVVPDDISREDAFQLCLIKKAEPISKEAGEKSKKATPAKKSAA